MSYEEQIMSKDKYPSIFSPQIGAIVFIILQIFFATRAIFKVGEYSRIFPSFSWGIFGHVTRLGQSRVSKKISWIIITNIFIHIQQPNLHSRNIFIHIYLCISYSRLYLLTFTRCLHAHSTSYIHSHSRSKYSFNIFCASPLRISIKHGLRSTEYGLRTGYKTRTQV